jgi:integrase
MEKKYLFRYRNKQGQHKPTWYVRLVVPPTLRKSIGKQHIVISLKTRDINIAREKRHAIVNEIRALFERTRRDLEKGTKQQYRVDPKKFLEAAKTLHEGLLYLSGDNAEGRGLENNLFSDYIEQHLAKRYRRDPETGHFIDVPPEIESEIARGFSILQRSNRKSFGETIELHLETLRQHTTYQTIATRKARVLRFLHWLGDDPFIDTIERETINSYLREDLMKQDYSISTIKCHLSDIRAVFSWAVENGMIQHKDNPVSGLTRQMVETPRRKKEKSSRKLQIWTEDELLKILSAAADHRRPEMLSVFVIALYSGMRREEIAQTELVNIDDTSIYLPGRKAINSIKYVPIHPIKKPLIDKLKGQRESGYLIKNFIGKPTMDGKRAHHFSETFSKLKKSSGITRKGVVFHSLRHTFYHAAMNSGLPAYAIDAITGRVAPNTSPYTYSQNVDLKTLNDYMQIITHGKKVDRAVKAAIKSI